MRRARGILRWEKVLRDGHAAYLRRVTPVLFPGNPQWAALKQRRDEAVRAHQAEVERLAGEAAERRRVLLEGISVEVEALCVRAREIAVRVFWRQISDEDRLPSVAWVNEARDDAVHVDVERFIEALEERVSACAEDEGFFQALLGGIRSRLEQLRSELNALARQGRTSCRAGGRAEMRAGRRRQIPCSGRRLIRPNGIWPSAPACCRSAGGPPVPFLMIWPFWPICPRHCRQGPQG